MTIHTAAILTALTLTSSAFAAEQGDLTLQPISNGTSTFQYNLTFKDPGTTNLGSFWFSWIPGIDFLPSQPTDLHSPAGWSSNVIAPAFSGDGYSIQWFATSPANALTPGSSLSGFSFSSTDDPTLMAGASPIYFGYYQTTITYAYIGAPETDFGSSFNATVLPTITATPEPASLSLTTLSLLPLLLKRRRP